MGLWPLVTRHAHLQDPGLLLVMCGQSRPGKRQAASIAPPKGVQRTPRRRLRSKWPPVHLSWMGILWALWHYKQDHGPSPMKRKRPHEGLDLSNDEPCAVNRHLFDTLPVFRRQVFKAVTIRHKRIRTGRGSRCPRKLVVLFTSFYAVDSVKCSQGCTNFRIPLQEASNKECEFRLPSPAQFW